MTFATSLPRNAVTEGRHVSGDLKLRCDVVIIGSGAAGSVVAAELAEAGQSVIVLEEGPYIPADTYSRFRPSEAVRHMWRDGAMTAAFGVGNSPLINVMTGRAVGGSSTLTGGVCFRVPESVLAVWRDERGLKEITPEHLEPAYRKVEETLSISEVPKEMRGRSLTLFEEGAAKRGFAMKPLRRNMVDCCGCGRCNFTCPHHAKRSVDLTYLPRATQHDARLVSDCLVKRVIVKRGRAVGVTGVLLDGPDARPKGRIKVRARRVVVATGAWVSPLLLKASGIGKRSRMVGKNMTLHPSFRMSAVFDQNVEGWKGAMQAAYCDAFEHERITIVGLFIPPSILAATMPGFGAEMAARSRRVSNMVAIGGMIHDEGGGTVHRGPGREPIVTYKMAPQDRAAVPVLLRTMAETYLAAGAKEVFLPILGHPPVDGDELRKIDLENIPMHRFESASQHPLGTCRMGDSPDNSVVDPNGETWDVKELYIADGSIVPTSLGVNPQLTVMTMATRVAWKMRDKPLPRWRA